MKVFRRYMTGRSVEQQPGIREYLGAGGFGFVSRQRNVSLRGVGK